MSTRGSIHYAILGPLTLHVYHDVIDWRMYFSIEWKVRPGKWVGKIWRLPVWINKRYGFGKGYQ